VLPLADILALIKYANGQTVNMIGQGRDAFAYGEIYGRLAALSELQSTIERIVEESNQRGEEQ
jgi:hypothetical protein